MNIHIQFIKNEDQRYDTWGDWQYTPTGDLIISVSRDIPELPTEEHQVLVALHELIEVLLCRKRGITQQQVDNFDMTHEDCEGEVGDLTGSPYQKEHRFAMIIEHLMAHELGIEGYGKVE